MGLFNINRAIDSVRKGLDNLITTKDEKQKNDIRASEIVLEEFKSRISLSSITRRYLAWSVWAVFLIFILIGGFSIVFKWELHTDIMSFLDKTGIKSLIESIGVLYFGSYGVSNIVKSAKHGK